MLYINTVLFEGGRFMESLNQDPSSEFSQRNFLPFQKQLSLTIGEKPEIGCSYEHIDGPIVFLIKFYTRQGKFV